MRKYFLSLLSILTLTIFSCSNTQKQNPLSKEWAHYIGLNPGTHKLGTKKADNAIRKAEQLIRTAYKAYQKKNNKLAVNLYEKALKLYATGQLYFRYANSLSNTPRLKDAATAYQIARWLGFKKDGVVAYNAACAHSRLGQTAKAALLLRTALSEGYDNIKHIEQDSDLIKLRNSPQWNKMRSFLKKIEAARQDSTTHKLISAAIHSYNLKKLTELKKQNGILRLPKPMRIEIFFKLVHKNSHISVEQKKRKHLSPSAIKTLEFMAHHIMQPNDTKLEDDNRNVNPIMNEAIRYNLPTVAGILLKRGANPNSFTTELPSSYSALLLAIQGRHHTLIQMLLKRGANPNEELIREVASQPLLIAIFNNDTKTAQLLLRYGANPHRKDQRMGITALQYAISENRTKIVALFNQQKSTNKVDTKTKQARQFFKKNYTMKKLINTKNGIIIAFKAGVDFVNKGIGTSTAKNSPIGYPYAMHSIFTLKKNIISITHSASYLAMKLFAQYRPAGKKGLYINGDYYRVGIKISNLKKLK